MRKIIGLSFLAVGLLLWTTKAEAAASVRGAKVEKIINNSATAQLACGAGSSVLYSVVVSSGATSDFVVVRDSGTANTSSAIAVSIGQATTGVTNVTFDPPIQFDNGISFNGAATTNSILVTCERGRVIQGY